MCLEVRSMKPKIAEYDMTCYKVLQRVPRAPSEIFGFRWETPFQRMCVPNSVVSGRRLMKARGYRKVNKSLNREIYVVGEGYIHVYASDELDNQKGVLGKQDNLFECIIPAGTEYYDGWNITSHEYASRSIRFVKQIF